MMSDQERPDLTAAMLMNYKLTGDSHNLGVHWQSTPAIRGSAFGIAVPVRNSNFRQELTVATLSTDRAHP